jgi:hypothetical protein
MSEIVELVKTITDAGWIIFGVMLIVALGMFVFDRPRKLTAAEETAESRPAKAA